MLTHLKKISLLAFFGALLFLLNACSKPYYISSDFKKRSKKQETLAILPVKMVFTGKMPEHLDDKDIVKLEEGESKAFQRALFDQILASSSRGKKKSINFQSLDKTNALLEENKVTVRQAWEESPEKLAAILGVDAVVKASVEKKRYLSDMASFGIDIGKRILQLLGGLEAILAIPKDVEKTNDIFTSCSVVDSQGGVILWSMSEKQETDWQKPDMEVVQNVCKTLAKNFPYRVGE